MPILSHSPVFQYISVLTYVRDQSHPSPPLHEAAKDPLLLMFCTTTEWLRTSFNYGCSPDDPAEQIVRSQVKLMAYLFCIIVQVFFSISFPSVTSHLFELYAGETTIQPRTSITKKIKHYTVTTKWGIFGSYFFRTTNWCGFLDTVSSRTCTD